MCSWTIEVTKPSGTSQNTKNLGGMTIAMQMGGVSGPLVAHDDFFPDISLILQRVHLRTVCGVDDDNNRGEASEVG